MKNSRKRGMVLMLNKEKSAGGSATPSAEKITPIIITQAKEKSKVSDVKKRLFAVCSG